ncbi:FAD:protein FMN transferase [Shimia aestuarii]|uniref:FAD:protein FMN transferase n=1 Tax=Shimia aestuarii TaxID=254406 RepID=UPI001FB3148A|nr:FAD:protein FMN transferase [Shimia aestuarii]
MRRLLVLLLLPLAACLPGGEREVLRLSGQTMGTQYHIIAIGEDLDEVALGVQLETVLADVDSKMSNWNPESEISRFSASQDTSPQPISPELAHVIQGAAEVHTQSEGMFDVTLGPLIELWGFGTRQAEDPVPSEAEIAKALTRVGQSRLLRLDPEFPSLAKEMQEVEVNVAAIAKGYGIDAVAAILHDAGIENYMVEIGGDLVTRGQNDKGQPWRIGIETPEPGSQNNVQRVIALSGLGMASSGDYRNFFERDGRRYSHLLDPTTGRPVTHATTSATVLAENAMMADAWATAMLVLGRQRGLAVAERHGVAVFFISRDRQADGQSYILDESSAFTALTKTD